MKTTLLFLVALTVGIVCYLGVQSLASLPQWQPVAEHQIAQQSDPAESSVRTLGLNSNDEIIESSGLANSNFVDDAVWTHNDSGMSNELFLLKTSGEILGKLKLGDVRNEDWEAMSRFNLDETSYLLVADVGDNSRNRDSYQIFIAPEPDFSGSRRSGKFVPSKSIQPTKIEFTYEDGPKNCEAVCVNELEKQIWLVEKVYYNARQKSPPGIYVLPLAIDKNNPQRKPLIAKRIADFPPLSVTGMSFSPDGKRLIIRNYVNAHLYSRDADAKWQDVVANTKPSTVVLPLQRQGEAVCFTKDSRSIILTSEFKRQPIWLVELSSYFEDAKNAKIEPSKPER